MDPTLKILKRVLQVTKSLERDNIDNLCLRLNRNKIIIFQLI